ncbi:IclR family transcriptional regulator [Paenibacillus thalictri]|uniref:Glycerol operon regulatory protein n=1 Tax=Paenibacillus thalictri TaxID=2527873 RepID=A0A4Q9DKQ5_9BACL|nr:IclR family transcriptional regulator [Paenibacillus thalictri]TBL73300.1 IclR family transcriptional regulator [Paenibacillus thalictri]
MCAEEKDKDKYSANALARGLEILTMFNDEHPTLSLAEIAQRLGVSRTTPFRLLYTLQSLGYLRQDENTKRYELTPKVLRLGFAYVSNLQFTEIARPYLQWLRDETGISTHLGILDGHEVVYVARFPARGVAAFNIKIGARVSAHVSAMGKCFLAHQTKENVRDILAEPKLEHVATDEFLASLEVVRKRGYDDTYGEFSSGIRSYAAPIIDNTGKVIAAMNVIGSEDLYVKESDILTKVLDAAEKLSASLGYRNLAKNLLDE